MTKKEEIDINQLKQQELAATNIKEGVETPEELNDAFFEEHRSMIEAMVAGIISAGKVPPATEFDDLVSWGMEGLIKAYHKFDASKGSQFKTYAYYRIRGEIFDKIRTEWRYRNPTEYQNYRKQARSKIADTAEAALDDLENSNKTGSELQAGVNRIVTNTAVACLLSIDDMEVASNTEGTKNPEIEFIDEKASPLWEEIHHLDEDEKKIIELFYIQDLKQKEIAEKLNMSRSTVCRMHMKILDKLRVRLKDKVP